MYHLPIFTWLKYVLLDESSSATTGRMFSNCQTHLPISSIHLWKITFFICYVAIQSTSRTFQCFDVYHKIWYHNVLSTRSRLFQKRNTHTSAQIKWLYIRMSRRCPLCFMVAVAILINFHVQLVTIQNILHT